MVTLQHSCAAWLCCDNVTLWWLVIPYSTLCRCTVGDVVVMYQGVPVAAQTALFAQVCLLCQESRHMGGLNHVVCSGLCCAVLCPLFVCAVSLCSLLCCVAAMSPWRAHCIKCVGCVCSCVSLRAFLAVMRFGCVLGRNIPCVVLTSVACVDALVWGLLHTLRQQYPSTWSACTSTAAGPETMQPSK